MPKLTIFFFYFFLSSFFLIEERLYIENDITNKLYVFQPAEGASDLSLSDVGLRDLGHFFTRGNNQPLSFCTAEILFFSGAE